MNDFDVIYDEDKKYYTMSVETIYQFREGNIGAQKYIKDIFGKFTAWMIQNNYSTETAFDICDAFTAGINITSHFESIEGLYACFKFLVNGFCTDMKENK